MGRLLCWLWNVTGVSDFQLHVARRNVVDALRSLNRVDQWGGGRWIITLHDAQPLVAALSRLQQLEIRLAKQKATRG